MSNRSHPLVGLFCGREAFAVSLILLTFVAVNFTVATRTPTVFVDEPAYTDPAANFYLGSGFTSTMWGQDRHDFWTGNVPLYQFLMAGFFELFGFGLFQARAVNTLLAALAGWMIWCALKRTGLIKTEPYRLLSLILILSGSVSTLTIRTIRPDTTMFAVCAAVFLAWTLRSEKLRLPAVFLSSSLLPLSGMAMLPYTVLMLIVYVVTCGFGSVKTVAATLAGLAGGIGWLCLLYGYFSSIPTFLDSVLSFTVVKQAGPSLAKTLQYRLFGDGQDRPDTIFTSFFGNPFEFIIPKTLFDYSSALLFALILGLAILQRTRLGSADKKVLLFSLLMVLLVPPTLHVTAHYRAMYRWMTYMPLCVLTPGFAESILKDPASAAIRRIAEIVFLGAVLLGVPLRTVFIIPSWSERSVGPVNAAAERVIRKSDVVICNEKVYFAVRPLAKTVFATGLVSRGTFDQIKDLPASEITLLCMNPERPDELDLVTKTIGGNWQRVPPGSPEQESELARTRYNVIFYRKAGTDDLNR